MKFIATSSTGYTLQPRIYEISDVILMLKLLSPKEVKLKVSFDDIRQMSNFITNKTIRFTKNWFFYTILGFTKTNSGALCDIEAYVQLVPGIYWNRKVTGIEKFI